MASTKKNFFYNLILTVGNYIFPLLTFPYVSRVLGVSNIGVCNYVDSIVEYFVLFSALGINIAGVREIARNKENPEKLQQAFSSLFISNLVLTIVACIILVICTFYVDEFAAYRQFYLIGWAKLLLTAFSVNWLFQGLSEFKFITTRSLIIRSLYVLSVFIFVHDEGDTFVYYVLTCMMTIFTAVWNWRYSLRFVHFSIRKICIGAFAAPILSFGFYQILTSMYSSFNVAFLGWTTDTTQVGYYTTATKLYGIIFSVFTAFTTVMIPRINELVAKGDKERLVTIAHQAFEIVFMFSIPVLIGSVFYAPTIINIISGTGYEGAITPFRIIMILSLLVAIDQIIVSQFLMAVTKSNCVMVISSVGAIVGLFLNFTLTPKYLSVGTAISLVSSEFFVFLTALYFFQKYYCMTIPWHKFVTSLLYAIPYCIIGYLSMNSSLRITIIGCIGMLVWFLILNMFIQRNQVLYDMIIKCRNLLTIHKSC